MVARERAIGALYILLGFVVGLIGGYIAISFRPKRKFLAIAEYWIYLPGDKMPDQNAIMTRTIGMNPYTQKGRTPVGTAEGLMFSDVRLHVAIALRPRNPNAFRPDLFNASMDVSPEALEALAEANSFVKVRFVSEDPLKDKRHLQFLPHLADAVAELGEGRLIYDSVAERLILREELQETLRSQVDVSGPDVHTRILWRNELEGGYAETRGLAKIGLPELKTPSSVTDQRVLILAVLEETVRRIWAAPQIPEMMDVEAFDDQFRVIFEQTREKAVRVRIARMRPA